MTKFKAGSLTIVQPEEGGALTIFDKDPDHQKPPLPNAFRVEPLEALGLLNFLRAQEVKFKETVVRERLEREENSWP